MNEYRKVDSTQKLAGSMALRGAPEGTVVVATTQSEGRGRYSRRWKSPQGGLFLSLVLKPGRERAPLFALVGALAVVHAIENEGELAPMIRWPNDVIINGKKVGGVLATGSYAGGTLSHVVVGIGVNCNFNASKLGRTSGRATTLFNALGKSVDLVSFRNGILGSFAGLYSGWEREGDLKVVTEIRGRLSTLGRQVIYLSRSGSRVEGKARGLSRDGSLLVSTSGRTARLRPEDVRWIREL